MPYTPITLLSQLIAGETDPADAEAANLLAAAQRQVKNFLGTYLTVAHEDDGRLKSSAILDVLSNSDLTFVPGTGTIDEPMFNDGVVSNRVLAPNAVTTDKILNGTILAEDLSDGAVTNPKLAANAVTNVKIADATITTAKLAGDNLAAAIADGTIPAKAMALAATPADAMLLMIGDTTGHSAVAQVGGMLTATADRSGTPTILKFAFNAADNIAWYQGGPGAGPTTALLSRIYGTDALSTIAIVGGVTQLTIVETGLYRFDLMIAAAGGTAAIIQTISSTILATITNKGIGGTAILSITAGTKLYISCTNNIDAGSSTVNLVLTKL